MLIFSTPNDTQIDILPWGLKFQVNSNLVSGGRSSVYVRPIKSRLAFLFLTTVTQPPTTDTIELGSIAYRIVRSSSRRSETNIWPGAWVMTRDRETDVAASWEVTPQAQNMGILPRRDVYD